MTLYSHSRLTCFENCPQKYKFSYIDKIKTETEQTIEAFTGVQVHRTLEKLYRDLMYEKHNTLEELMEYLRDDWEKNYNDSIIVVRKEYTPENYLRLAERCIQGYYQQYHPFNQNRTLALEERIVISLDKTDRYRLQGYIDRVSDLGNSRYGIHDYKTSMHLPLPEDIEKDRQLALYSLAIQEKYPDAEEIKLIWHFLAFQKTLESQRSQEELDDLKKQTIHLIDKIEEARDFPPRVSALCDWCEFRTICKEWAHLAQLEKKTVNQYLHDTGVELVNRYIELRQKKRDVTTALDHELEQIQDALIHFAEKEKIDVIFGSDNKIRVRMNNRYTVPPKETTERMHLEKVLKNMGKWEEVTQLDYNTLNKILIEESWEKPLLDTVKEYMRLEQAKRLYPSKIKTR